jgi:UDP-N-acetylmuramoylalanine--D-glutamate ligase
MAKKFSEIVMHTARLIRPGETAVVVGAGRSGLAAARLLGCLGARVRLLEQKQEVAERIRDLAAIQGWEMLAGEHGQKQFAQASLVVLSPGVNRRNLAPWLEHLDPAQVISELELACRCVSEPIIAVTGTNGKTTTTTLIGRFLCAMGRKVFVGGNIGTPLSEYVVDGAGAEILVLEVSSFQLQNSFTFRPQVGVLLNISPNHLDWHADMNEYVQAKLSMFARQDEADLAIFPEEMRETLDKPGITKARRVFFGAKTRLRCAALRGRHNQANMEAAFLACEPYGLDEATAQKTLDSFQALPHRLQVVTERDGVLFVDDSKGTTVQSLAAALESFDRPILLLAGGVFKGGDLSVLAPLVADKVRIIGLFGASREAFEQAWGSQTTLFWEPTLEGAVDRLWTEARPGEVMLLSPATASFDLFADYKARGRAFQKRVQSLPERRYG